MAIFLLCPGRWRAQDSNGGDLRVKEAFTDAGREEKEES